MFTPEEKRFFATTANSARYLSKCPEKQGAILVRGTGILSYGCNRDIGAPGFSVVIPAIQSAICNNLVEFSMGSGPYIIFSSYFPRLSDVKIILSLGIHTVYFFGEINDPEAIKAINSYNEQASLGTLEMIQLEN